MKKAFKIISYFLGSLILVVLLLFIFHDALLGYALKRTISNKSGGKVILKLDEIDLNLRKGNISIVNPEFLLDTVFVDESQNIVINRILFEKIEIDRLNIKRLITDGDIIASRFLVDRPQFWITEKGYNEKSSFHPEKLLSFLTNNPNALGGIKIQIPDVEITYGSIRVKEMVMPDMDPGKVDFTIILEDFNTLPDPGDDKIRYLYAREISFKLKQLRRLLKSGYLLEIDSAIFSTFKKDMVAGGISLQPVNLDNDKNSIGLYAGKVVINDLNLEEVRGMEDLTLRSVILADGHFTNYSSSNFIPKSDTAHRPGLEILTKLLHEFELDTFSLNNFRYFNIHDQADTMLASEGLQFLATYITFDTSAFVDLIRNVEFNKVAFQTGPVKTKMIQGIDLSYDGLYYSTEENDLLIRGIKVVGDSVFSKKKLELKLLALNIQGISLKDLQQNKTQEISIIAKNADVDFDLEHPILKGNGGKGHLDIKDRVRLNKVRIENSNLQIAKDKSLDLILHGLDFEVDGLNINSLDSGDVQYENLFIKYDDLALNLTNNKHRIQTRQFILDDNHLSINRLNGSTWLGNPETRNDFSLRALNLNEFDLKRLITEKEIFIGQVNLSAPVIVGGIQLKGSDNKPERSDSDGLIPYRFEIGSLVLSNGRYDGKIIVDTNDIAVAFDYHLRLGKLSAGKGDSLNVLLNQLSWDLGIQNIDMEAADHEIKIDSLLSSTFTSRFRMKNLIIKDNPDRAVSNEGISFKNISVPLVDVTKLNYSMLLNQDSINLDRLTIDQPTLDIVLPKTTIKKEPKTMGSFDLNKYLLFSYNVVDVTNLNFRLEKPGDSSLSVISVEDFIFKHDIDRDNDLNLTNNILFSFRDFQYKDTIRDKFLTVNEGMLLPEKGEFRISGIRGGNLARKPGQEKEFGLTGTEFRTSGITFTGIHLTESLPSQLLIGRLNIDDFNLDIIKKKDLSKKMVFKLKLEVMRRYSKILTGVHVDTVSLENINFHYITFSDTSSQSIIIDSIGILVKSVKVDTSMIDQSEPNLIGNLTIDLKGRTTVTHDSLYEIKTGYLHFDFPTHQITIDSFHLRPRYKDEEFFSRSVYQTDRAIIEGRKIELNDFSIDDLIINDHLHFGSVNLIDFNFDLCRDKRFPFAPGIYKKLLREQIMSVEQKFTVDSLLLNNAILHYKEIEEKTGQAGTIFFDQVNARGYNLTNNIDSNDRTTRMLFKMHGNIMGQAGMDISVYFPLYPDTVAFWLSAKSDKIDMPSLNPVTENLLGIGILNGKGSVDIPLIIAGNDIARGNMTFRYKKLKLAMYDRKKEQMNKGFLSPFVNFLINDLVVKSNNPKFARKPRIGQVYFERDTRKGIVNYAWKSILSGMLSTLGFNNKEQRLEKKAMKKNQ